MDTLMQYSSIAGLYLIYHAITVCWCGAAFLLYTIVTVTKSLGGN